MNLMLLASVAVILLCALIGYRRGLIKSAVSAVGIIGAVILTNVLNPYKPVPLSAYTTQRHREAEGGAEHRSGRYQ